MAMYECAECGEEHGTLPQVFLAVNTLDRVYPYHNTKFENEFHKLWQPTGVEHYDSKGWEKFWAWLGDNEIQWFCSQNCAIRFLMKTMTEEKGG